MFNSNFTTGAFFEVYLDKVLWADFTSVTGLGMEFEYETYNEGGVNYPRHFFKGVVPQKLVLEHGVITGFVDAFALWISSINAGCATTLKGAITLKSSEGNTMKSWEILGAIPVKYVGPDLNALSSNVAISRLELLYNGCV